MDLHLDLILERTKLESKIEVFCRKRILVIFGLQMCSMASSVSDNPQ